MCVNKTHEHSTLVACDQDLGHKSTTKKVVLIKRRGLGLWRKAMLLMKVSFKSRRQRNYEEEKATPA